MQKAHFIPLCSKSVGGFAFSSVSERFRQAARLFALLMLPGGLLPVVAIAQATGKSDDPLLYQGPDRQSRLVEKAKKEGSLTIYTSLAPTEAEPIAQAFEKKYGIKVELW